MRFTEQHEVERPSDADWFDLNTEMDSPLYVDPFLLFEDSDPFWSAGHEEIIDFFDAALELLKTWLGTRCARSKTWSAKCSGRASRSRLR